MGPPREKIGFEAAGGGQNNDQYTLNEAPTWLSSPSSSSMIKNRMAQSVGIGIMDTALG